MTDYWVLIFFNLLFTSAPPVIYGVLEKDVSAETLVQLPELYKSGQESEVGAKAKTLRAMHIRCQSWHFSGSPAPILWYMQNYSKLFKSAGYFRFLLTANIKLFTSEVNRGKIMKDLKYLEESKSSV